MLYKRNWEREFRKINRNNPAYTNIIAEGGEEVLQPPEYSPLAAHGVSCQRKYPGLWRVPSRRRPWAGAAAHGEKTTVGQELPPMGIHVGTVISQRMEPVV